MFMINSVMLRRRFERVGTRGRTSSKGQDVKYEVRLFGPFTILQDGERIDEHNWRRSCTKTLLKWFLLNPGRSFGCAALSEILWPGHDFTSNRIHVALHHLRRLLEPDLTRVKESRFIRSIGNGSYRFDLADCWKVDVLDVAELLKEAKAARLRGDLSTSVATYQKAIAYYERGFLPEDLYENAFTPFRAAHDRHHDQALHQVLRLSLALGDHYEALSCAMRLAERDPYSEDAVAAIVRIHLRQGSTGSALAQLEEFTEKARRDLGVAPSRRLTDLFERVRLDQRTLTRRSARSFLPSP